MHYRTEIDGLRAIAVMSVILYHAGFVGLGGGYAGVDIFFVISGFLIGGQIVRDKSAGTFSYKDFYARRARR
ncbi:MAG: acyltransferase, partial [Paracoccaceae bacterium]|nr:acyltransferase [Paracoccaceae bacterium]